VFCATPFAAAQTITVATYNVERFAEHFEGYHASTQPVGKADETKPLVDDLKLVNDKENWMVAETILDPKFNPDILVIEEGCDQNDLNYFNDHWLHKAYKVDLVLPTNTDRHQNLCILIKDGFKILDKKDKYYLEKDPVGNERGNRLF